MRAPARPAWPEIVVVGALVLACLLLVPKVIGTARYDAAILRFPFQVDDAEGVVLAEARLIAEGTEPVRVPAIARARTSTRGRTRRSTRCSIARRWPSTARVSSSGGRCSCWRRSRSPCGSPGRCVAPRGSGRGWLVGGWIAAALRVGAPRRGLERARAAGYDRARLESARRRRAPRLARSDRARVVAGGSVAARRVFGRLALGAACFALGWWTKQTFVAVPVAFLISVVVQSPESRP